MIFVHYTLFYLGVIKKNKKIKEKKNEEKNE
jgi:hypothetical protein